MPTCASLPLADRSETGAVLQGYDQDDNSDGTTLWVDLDWDGAGEDEDWNDVELGDIGAHAALLFGRPQFHKCAFCNGKQFRAHQCSRFALFGSTRP